MTIFDVKFSLKDGAVMPAYQTPGSAGLDCHAYLPEGTEIISKGERKLIPLGFSMELPDGAEAQIRGRSGMTSKKSIDCFVGTVDADYRGEVACLLINNSDDNYEVKNGDRVCQMVVNVYAKIIPYQVKKEELSETVRGDGGFGSTGGDLGDGGIDGGGE